MLTQQGLKTGGIGFRAALRKSGFTLAFILTAPAVFGWPDLLVKKTGPVQAAPGEIISYTLTYSNAGPVKSTGVMLRDYLPPKVTAITSSLGSAVLSNSVITWSLGTVNANANGSRSFQVRIDPTAISGTFLTNRAQINGIEAEEPGKTANNTNSFVTKIFSTNHPPVAQGDFYSVNEDTALMVTAPGVLSNDSDPDGNALAAGLVTSPAHGTLTLNSNGGFVYTPAANYNGTDSFTYQASDGVTNSTTATVTITVNPINDAPIAANDSYTTAEDVLLSVAAPGVLANDTDPDGDGLTALLVTGPTHGTLTLNSNGSFTYRPATNYNGPDTFSYRAGDGITNSPVAWVNLTVTPVNDAPVAVNDSYTTAVDVLLSVAAPGVLANDADPDGDGLNALLVTAPTHGTLTFNSNGSFTYRPATNYNGPDTFSYRAGDGITNSQVAWVSLTVTPVNDAPVAVNDSYTTTEDTALVVTTPGVLANDSDPDGDGLTALLVGAAAHGTVTLHPDGSFSYLPTTNYAGSDTFSYRASDGLTNSAVATVTIQVSPINHPPNTNNWTGSQFTAYEDTPLQISSPGVLAGISDADGDALTATLVLTTGHGLLSLNPAGAFTYVPELNYNGTDTFTFRISDGHTNTGVLTARINVLPVNDAPSFTKGTNQLVQQNVGTQTISGWAGNISAGPSDEAGQIVTFQVTADQPELFAVPPAITSDGTLTFTPATNKFGRATVTVVAQDNGGTANGGVDHSLPQTFSITINSPPIVAITSPTNGAFFFAPASFTVLADAHDPDGTVTKVQFFGGTNLLATATSGPPYFVVLTNLPVGTYTYYATATDDHEATSVSTSVTLTVLERPPLSLLSTLQYNPQTDFYEVRVRVTNPTYSTVDAIRVCVLNLTNVPAITVHNVSGYTNGVPYIQTPGEVPPGSAVDMTIEFYSPKRIAPNPILRPELVTATGTPSAPSGVAQRINHGRLMGDQTFMVEFATLSNRVYSVQYSRDLKNWKPSAPSVAGDGGWVQWIDNGLPKTEAAPASQPARFYRVILLP